jgi:hypothetical protein
MHGVVLASIGNVTTQSGPKLLRHWTGSVGNAHAVVHHSMGRSLTGALPSCWHAVNPALALPG